MAVDQTLISYILNPWDGTYQPNSTLVELSYSNLDFTPSTSDSYKSTSGDIFKVYVNGVRIYRSSDASYASGYGFLESGDIDNSTLNGISGVSWNDTSDSVWTIDTANELILLNTAAILSTTLYGPSNLDLSFVSGTTVIQIDRVVQDQRTPAVDFSNASILTEQDLDSNSKNVFHIAQEAIDFASRTIRTDAFGAFDAQGQELTNVSQLIVQNAPTLDKNVVTKTYLEDTWLSPTDKTNAATVQTLSAEIDALGNNPYKADVETVADATYKAQVQTVADATYKGKIETVANATYKAQVETLADAAYKADIETVADSAYFAEIQTVADDLQTQVSEIKTVADDLQTGVGSEIKTVADDLQLGTSSKVKTVSDDLQGTNTIGTVANATYKAKVETLADATYKAKVETVADDLLGTDDIGTVATSITNVNTVAAGIADVNNYADTYYGSHDFTVSEPVGSFNAGDLIFDSGNNVVKVYNGTGWQNATSSVEGVIATQEYTGDNTTQYFAFTVDQGMELVYLNGVKMLRGSDYECTSSNTSTTGVGDGGAASYIYFTTAPATGDVISIVGFGQSDNTLAVPVSGGTFTGNVAVNGTLTPGTLDVSSGTLTLADNQISGDKIHDGTISNFRSTGIDDNASTTALTIDSSGNVGIGATNPAYKLEIAASQPWIRLNDTDGTTAYAEILTSSGSLSLSANPLGTGLNSYIAAYINNTERMRIDSSGHVIAPYGVTLGTAVATYNAANTLDDYEEGTWTMATSGSTLNLTSILFNTEKYVIIGKVVYAFFSGSFTVTTANARTIMYVTVPFSSASSTSIKSGSFGIRGPATNYEISSGRVIEGNAVLNCVVEVEPRVSGVFDFNGVVIYPTF